MNTTSRHPEHRRLPAEALAKAGGIWLSKPLRSLRFARLCLAAVGMTMILSVSTFAAEEKKTEESSEQKAAEKADDDDIGKKEEAKAEENPNRYGPDFCDFEIIFPEPPAIVEKCVPGADCYEMRSYTMVYDLQTTVDVSAICNPSTPTNYKRYTENVMKAALAGMVEDRNLKQHEIKFSQEENVRSAALTGVGTTGAQEKIYTGQLWIGQNSVFTVQAELVGSEHPKADKAFSDILQSIKIKQGKQLPKKEKATSIPKGANQ